MTEQDVLDMFSSEIITLKGRQHVLLEQYPDGGKQVISISDMATLFSNAGLKKGFSHSTAMDTDIAKNGGWSVHFTKWKAKGIIS